MAEQTDDTTANLGERFQAALKSADAVVSWRREPPAEHLARLAAHAEETDLGWDGYGERGAVAALEEQVAELLGKPAAVLLPSGVMAQQSVLRVHCDRAGSTRVALPDLSHLLHHEADGPRLVHGLRLEWLTTGRKTPTAGHLADVPGHLGAVLVELPLRDAGCLLPPWDDLAALSAAARERGVALHLDGARLWESQPSYDRPLAEIAGLFDSVYVSLYKGLGAMAGAVVATDDDTAAELRLWRTRMGGTLMRLTPYALGGLLGLRDELPRMGEYLAWARQLAAALAAKGITVEPEGPHVTTYFIHAPHPADEVNERLLAVAERESVVLTGPFRPADVPGHSVTEVALYGAAVEHDVDVVAEWFATVIDGAAD
jgi:threonine aldolase